MRSVVVPLMILTAILDEPQPRDCGTCSAACCPERLLCWIGSIPRCASSKLEGDGKLKARYLQVDAYPA
jgi:hypothetical protein